MQIIVVGEDGYGEVAYYSTSSDAKQSWYHSNLYQSFIQQYTKIP